METSEVGVTGAREPSIAWHDPLVDSVSLAFYERGWRGIHVEPMPALAAKLRAARPDETVVEAAISSVPGTLELAQVGLSGLTTGVPEIGRAHATAGFPTEPIVVATNSSAGRPD